MAPFTVDQLIAFALSHHRAGRFAEAEGIYRKILGESPAHPVALDYLGVLALQTDRLELGAGILRQAVAVSPSNANAHTNLGECYRRLGKPHEAAAAFQEAIRLAPGGFVAHNNFGVALAETGRFDEAIAAYRKAISADPGYADAYTNLCNALLGAGRAREAVVEGERAVALKPSSAAMQVNLGAALMAAGRCADAVAAYRRAIELDPRHADAHSNLGNALCAEGRVDEALAASAKAIEVDPRLIQSHWNYAVILLRAGDFERGWREYEWRWKTQAHFPKPPARFQPPRFPTPHWDGSPLQGKTILLHTEQGFGDAIQFCRYAPMVAPLGAEVIVECRAETREIFRSLPRVGAVVARGETLPRFDCHCPLMSLPLALGTTLRNVPATVPYLFPPPDIVGAWAARLDRGDGRAQVGLCWAGSPLHHDDRRRSISLADLAPLAGLATFHSLQQTPFDEGLAPPGMRLIDHSAALTDFSQTAGLIANLDLIITVDTAVAHLAGALGKPTWTLLAFYADWRWLTKRSDSPWYPTMRLFRQSEPGNWGQVIQRVAEAFVLH
ncbi:MAG TPA: tetratricopeptide repeat-containing glycosyltransferase family protein [Tepidisphaeraceae bacterium]|nr:tetratricopeptide repeat-containing glycosyltransferase family protein [Tepidisphaeraceae bacterium]